MLLELWLLLYHNEALCRCELEIANYLVSKGASVHQVNEDGVYNTTALTIIIESPRHRDPERVVKSLKWILTAFGDLDVFTPKDMYILMEICLGT